MEGTIKWKDLVEEIHQNSQPTLVRVCEVDDDINRNDVRIRVGDELFLRQVIIEDVQLSLHNPNNITVTDNRPERTMVLPTSYEGKFEVCPHHPSSHIFASVKDLLAVYPFVSDFIYPLQSFTIEGVKIREYDLLHVITTVQESSRQCQFLEVKVVTKNTPNILLPQSLKICFQQWNDECPLPEAESARRLKPRMFSITQLADYFCPNLHPMKVKLYSDQVCTECKKNTSPSKDPLQKFVSIFQKPKEKKTETNYSVTEVHNINHSTFPSNWWGNSLTLEPIHTVMASNANTGTKIYLTGNMDLKVAVIEHERTSSSRSSSTAASSKSTDSLFDDHHRSSSSSSESSVSLNHFDVSSLLSSKSRDDAIVAIVTGGRHTASRPQDSLSIGSWVALHRARKVRKLLFMSKDAQKQHFLVSAQYAGQFSRVPVIYDYAGQVPIDETIPYVVKCSAYPAQKDLDYCQEGHYVWFIKKTLLELSDGAMLVVHCKKADTLDGAQTYVTFPQNLRGKFRKVEVEEKPTTFSSQELFKQNFPLDVSLSKTDSSIGFDPLAKKDAFMVCKTVAEMTVIVEILKKTDEGIKSSGTLMEVPLSRSSLFVKEATPASMCGVVRYPRLKEFKGLQKLPSVELLADQDIDMLDDVTKQSTCFVASPDCRQGKQQSQFTLPDSLPQSSPISVDQNHNIKYMKRDSGIADVLSVPNTAEIAPNSERKFFNSNMNFGVSEEAPKSAPLPTKETEYSFATQQDQLRPVPKPRKKRQMVIDTASANVGNGHLPHTTAKSPTSNGEPHNYALVRKVYDNPAEGRAYSSPEYEFYTHKCS